MLSPQAEVFFDLDAENIPLNCSWYKPEVGEMKDVPSDALQVAVALLPQNSNEPARLT